ncbi:MAG: hypothetical protein WA197_19055 [Candidatus Acidiferrales bacterium]
MTKTLNSGKQDFVVSLDRETIRRIKKIARQRSTSVGALLTHQIDLLVAEDALYERAKRQALILLDHGFHLGGAVRVWRNEAHDR